MSVCQNKSSKSPKNIKIQKRRNRRDVIIKKILRDCRRFLHDKVAEHTGFISTKKLRKNDNFYASMQKFNIEVLRKQGTFEQNFYLACLLYPHDLSKDIDSFISKLSSIDIEEDKRNYREIIHQIHQTLYKYSHEKLDFFLSKPEIATIFIYFYTEGAEEKTKFLKEYEFINTKCLETIAADNTSE
jgi:hypothetical protein